MEKVNLGVNALWRLVYRDFTPYQDRLRSTNVREFTRDTTLDSKPTAFTSPKPVARTEFVADSGFVKIKK